VGQYARRQKEGSWCTPTQRIGLPFWVCADYRYKTDNARARPRFAVRWGTRLAPTTTVSRYTVSKEGVTIGYHARRGRRERPLKERDSPYFNLTQPLRSDAAAELPEHRVLA